MRDKLLIISVVAVLGIMGCSKEEETAAISPDVGQAQPSVAQVATAPVAAPTSGPATAVAPASAANAMPMVAAPAPTSATNAMPMAAAPALANTQAMPASSQSDQANTMTPKTLDMTNPSATSGANVGQGQAQQNLTPNTTAATTAPTPASAPDQQVVPGSVSAAANPVEVIDTTKIQEPMTVTSTAPMLEVKPAPEVKQVQGVANSVTTTVDKTPGMVVVEPSTK